jgi:preprotein translocase subunit SecA
LIYRTEREKYNAIVADIKETWKTGRPILVGTRSIEKSEKLAAMLRAVGIPHQVLNAKYHEMEAQIIAQAGRKGAVTIATNMAGRGTDILLGGTPQDPKEYEEVKALGGLYVLGTERHEARRIDNQLRGRCGRQGDPGTTRFYLALDDELMRLFGSDRLSGVMEKLGMTEGEVIESPLVSHQIAGAQRRVETHNFDIRKQLLEYDGVMNKQRTVVYELRNEILDNETVNNQIEMMIDEDLDEKIAAHCPEDSYPEAWDVATLAAYLERTFELRWAPTKEDLPKLETASLKEDLRASILERYAAREKEFEGFNFRDIEKMIMLQMIDRAWKGHLYELDQLKKSIGLVAYGQKDPKIEYQKEAFRYFEELLGRIREEVVQYVFRVQAPRIPPPPPPSARIEGSRPASAPQNGPAASSNGGDKKSILKKDEAPKDLTKLGRNDPCYCGSGKKYKKCHG